MPVKSRAKAKPKRKAPAKKKAPAKRKAPVKRRPRVQAGGGVLGDVGTGDLLAYLKKNKGKLATGRPRVQAGGGMLGDIYSYIKKNKGKIATGALVGLGGIGAGLAAISATDKKRHKHIRYDIHGDYGRDYGSTYGAGLTMPPMFFED